MAHSVVIVESPAKAATIGRYLGKDFKVLASYGHVRDLLSKSGSVDPDHDFKMVWEEKSSKPIQDILKAVKGSQEIFLATDPDREGEAIAWHVSQLIEQKYGAKKPPMVRIAFYEITRNAITEALKKPRQVDLLLVEAYLARRALDYLVGYSLSPVLWQKLPGSRSAGRVQSVALRLIVEREQEISAFKAQEYWTIIGKFEKTVPFQARLTTYQGKKLGKLDIKDQDQATEMVANLKDQAYYVQNKEEKQVQRLPVPPFTTSTLQQEASRKLGFGANRTMRIAQSLYEGIPINGELTGLITYMRTDSVTLSSEAITHFRSFIQNQYGEAYLPSSPRVYKTKTKNAQEAHEAIRPTDITRRVEDLAPFLDKDQKALYELIWKRALSSQMENAVFNQVTIDLSDRSDQNIFRAVGTTPFFDGFLKVYQEGTDSCSDNSEKEEELPSLKKNEEVSVLDVSGDQHFTQPPAHFTEASLVKKLEELGIGRPSTYASVIQVLQDRGYAILEKRQFTPSDRGRVVTAFLTNFCQKYLEYDFTAQMEDELDDISNGKRNWKAVMNDFWSDFSQTVSQMKSLSPQEVSQALEKDLFDLFFKGVSRTCEQCGQGKMELKFGRFGPFLGCSRYPECSYKRAAGVSSEKMISEVVDLGEDPVDGSKISLHRGPYGFYIQVENPSLQEESSKKRKKGDPSMKRISLPQTMDPAHITLDQALALKALPKEIGLFEEDPVFVHTGRFGPYVKWKDVLASIPKNIDFLNISLDQAISLIETKRKRASLKKASSKKSKKARS